MRIHTKQWLALAFAAAISGGAYAQAGGNSGGNGVGAGGGNAGGAAGVTVPGAGGANHGWNRSSTDTSGYGSPGVTGTGGGQGTGTGATPSPANRSMNGPTDMSTSPNSMQNNGQ